MNIESKKRCKRFLLPALMVFFSCQTPLLAETKTATATPQATPAPHCAQGSTCITVSGQGQDPLNKEKARQEKQQWDSTHKLRKKMNQQAEKMFDEDVQNENAQKKCQRSANLNAYWEKNTSRCLDRQTGQEIFIK